MKKLIVCVAAVALGLSASAATVDWQVSVSSASASPAYTAYLVDATAWDAATITADTFTDSSIVLDSTTFSSTGSGKGSAKTYTTIASGTTAGARAKDIASLAEGDTISVYYVLLDTSSDPNTYYTISDTLSGHASTGEAQLGTHTTVASATLASATWTPVGGGSGGGDVPEPTSGLLLLVGGAMLALRRKQK